MFHPSFLFRVLLVSFLIPSSLSLVRLRRNFGDAGTGPGRLEIRNPSTLAWGTVCDDGWTNANTAVACRELGNYVPSSGTSSFTGSASFTDWQSNDNTLPINLDDIVCTGSETTLDNCNHRAWGTSDCSRSEDIWISCTSVTNDISSYLSSSSVLPGVYSLPRTGRIVLSSSGGLWSSAVNTLAGEAYVSSYSTKVTRMKLPEMTILSSSIVSPTEGGIISTVYDPRTSHVFVILCVSGMNGQILKLNRFNLTVVQRIYLSLSENVCGEGVSAAISSKGLLLVGTRNEPVTLIGFRTTDLTRAWTYIRDTTAHGWTHDLAIVDNDSPSARSDVYILSSKSNSWTGVIDKLSFTNLTVSNPVNFIDSLTLYNCDVYYNTLIVDPVRDTLLVGCSNSNGRIAGVSLSSFTLQNVFFLPTISGIGSITAATVDPFSGASFFAGGSSSTNAVITAVTTSPWPQFLIANSLPSGETYAYSAIVYKNATYWGTYAEYVIRLEHPAPSVNEETALSTGSIRGPFSSCWQVRQRGFGDGLYHIARVAASTPNAASLSQLVRCVMSSSMDGGGWDTVSVVNLDDSTTSIYAPSPVFGDIGSCLSITADAPSCSGNVGFLANQRDAELLVLTTAPSDQAGRWISLSNFTAIKGSYGIMADYATGMRKISTDSSCAYGSWYNECNTVQNFDGDLTVRSGSLASFPSFTAASTIARGTYIRYNGFWIQNTVVSDNNRVLLRVGYWNAHSITGSYSDSSRNLNPTSVVILARTKSTFPGSPSPSSSPTPSRSVTASIASSASRTPSRSGAAVSPSSFPTWTGTVTPSLSLAPLSASRTPSSTVSPVAPSVDPSPSSSSSPIVLEPTTTGSSTAAITPTKTTTNYGSVSPFVTLSPIVSAPPSVSSTPSPPLFSPFLTPSAEPKPSLIDNLPFSLALTGVLPADLLLRDKNGRLGWLLREGMCKLLGMNISSAITVYGLMGSPSGNFYTIDTDHPMNTNDPSDNHQNIRRRLNGKRSDRRLDDTYSLTDRDTDAYLAFAPTHPASVALFGSDPKRTLILAERTILKAFSKRSNVVTAFASFVTAWEADVGSIRMIPPNPLGLVGLSSVTDATVVIDTAYPPQTLTPLNPSDGKLGTGAMIGLAILGVAFLTAVVFYCRLRSQKRTPESGLILRQMGTNNILLQRSASSGAQEVAPPLRLTQENDMQAIRYFWPDDCGVCSNRLRPGLRFRMCSLDHVCCYNCAVQGLRMSLRNSNLWPNGACFMGQPTGPTPCFILPDAVAAVFHAPSMLPPKVTLTDAPALLTVNEAQDFRTAQQISSNKYPNAWSFVPCAGCHYGILIPRATREAGNFPVYCAGCTHRVCVKCNVLWRGSGHENVSCAQFQIIQQQKREADIREAKASVAMAGDTTVQCPQCGEGITRTVGCDHMTCKALRDGTVCNHEFCWLCQAPYRGPNGILTHGNHMHRRHCKHYRPVNG